MFDTAANIITQAATELGLGTVSDAYASTNPAIMQLRAFLTSVGRKLVKLHGWSQLTKTHTLSWVDGEDEYDLPSDFARFVDDTGWDRTSQEPLVPANGRDWQTLKARGVTGILWPIVRIQGNKLLFHPVPSSTDSIAFEYISSLWALANGETAPNKNAPNANTDTVWFDATLMVDGIKYAWKAEKGFASQGSLDEYLAGLILETASDGAASVLYLNGRGPGITTHLGELNVPETGFGE